MPAPDRVRCPSASVHTWDRDLLAIDRELHVGVATRGRGKGARGSAATAGGQRWRARYGAQQVGPHSDRWPHRRALRGGEREVACGRGERRVCIR